MGEKLLMELLTSGRRLESPFLIVNIDGTKLGAFTQGQRKLLSTEHGELFDKTVFPNFIKGATIKKNANGMVNQYTLYLTYQISQYDDPNFIEKLFSRISNGRKIRVSYGDYMNPTHAFREEECIVSDIERQISPKENRIDYVVSAVSATSLKIGKTWNFPARKARPSTVLREIIYNKEYGLLDVLPGMRESDKVDQLGLLSANDIEVQILPRQNTSVIDYIKYLVGCMKDSDTFIQPTIYVLCFDGDVLGQMGGAYVKLVRLDEQDSSDEWTVDVGYPGTTDVFDFKLTETNMYSILFKYNQATEQNGSNTTRRELNEKGKVVSIFRQPLAVDPLLQRTTEVAANWWSQMVNYPLSGLLTIRGLIRPSILTSAVNINHWFYGQKFNTSGRYRIMSDTVRLNANGFFEDLGIIRIGGEINA